MNPATRKYRKIGKKGQVGETVSWIIATIIIIGILLIFIWISFLMSKVKIVKVGDVETDIKESNLLKEKTSFAHQIAGYRDKEIIDNILKEQNG